MIYGYIRVSTENQNLENQKLAISEKFEIDEWIEEKKRKVELLIIRKEV